MAKTPQSGKRRGKRGTKRGVKGPSRKSKSGLITEPIPLQERVAVLETDVAAERTEEIDNEIEAPAGEAEDDEEFDEEVEYDGETDDEGDRSEPLQGEGSPRAAGTGGPADLEIALMPDDNGRWAAEIFVPARAVQGRYRAVGWNRQLYDLNAQLDLLEPIGRMFVKEISGRWKEYLDARDLAEAGQLFSGFRQEKIAADLGEDPSVISRCRIYRVRLPKVGTVSLGELFDAAERGTFERAREVVARVRDTMPGKLDTNHLATLIIKELGVGKRQAQNYLKKLREKGLL